MADATPPDARPQHALAALVRMVLTYRLLSLLVSTVYLGVVGSDAMLAWVLVGVGIANLVPLLRWDRLAPHLLRHPAFLAVDLLVTIMILLVTGIEGPLLSYTFGTAFIAGVMYGWRGAAVFSSLLVGAYAALLGQEALATFAQDFHTVVGTPSLYVLLALGAAAVRALLLRQAWTEAALRTAREQAAHGDERARLARELHDTVGKTLHGISLLSTALPGWVRRDPERAIREAHALAAAVQSAASQARELLVGMRADRLDRALDDVVRSTVEAWLADLEVAPHVQMELEPVSALTPSQRIELLAVLREALRNVQRHARANHVVVKLVDVDETVVLRVCDDGRGLPSAADPERLSVKGHFGLLGMRERMELVGGDLRITDNEPSGVIVTAEVPIVVPRLRSTVDAPPLARTGTAP